MHSNSAYACAPTGLPKIYGKKDAETKQGHCKNTAEIIFSNTGNKNIRNI